MFDKNNSWEKRGERRTVTSIATGSDPTLTVYVTLNAPLTRDYIASLRYPPPREDLPDFHNLEGAGVGVLSGCDATTNQLNAANSCFFEGDMRGVEVAFNDAFVEFLGLRGGMGGVPYAGSEPEGLDALSAFSEVWFQNMIPAGLPPDYTALPHNYFHLIGAGNDSEKSSGYSHAPSDYAFVMVEWILTHDWYGSFGQYVRETTAHELAHDFRVNPCCPDDQGHDANFAWCGTANSISAPPGYEKCLMYENKDGDADWYYLISNDINRFCCINLVGQPPSGSPPCLNGNCPGEDGIRAHPDPE